MGQVAENKKLGIDQENITKERVEEKVNKTKKKFEETVNSLRKKVFEKKKKKFGIGTVGRTVGVCGVTRDVLSNVVLREPLNNEEILINEIEVNENSFNNININLRNSKDFCLKAIKKNGRVMKLVSNDFKNDKEFVLESVKNSSLCFAYISDKLKNDKEILLEASKDKKYSFLIPNQHLIREKEEYEKHQKVRYQELKSILFKSCKLEDIDVVERIGEKTGELKPKESCDFSTFGSECTVYLVKVKKKILGPCPTYMNPNTQKMLVDNIYQLNFAMKVIHNIGYNSDEITSEMIENEVIKVERLPYHPNICNIIHYFIDRVLPNKDKLPNFRCEDELIRDSPTDKTAFLLMDYYETNLKSFIINDKKRKLTIFDFLEKSKQILEGICHLHKNFIVHRDLKPV